MDMDTVHHRRFFIFSLVNWAVAIAAWTASAFLGVASPTSMLVYTILFVIGLIAVIVGVLAWLVARFGQAPER
jgi:hypothetical protein